ncbi:hypothetical protein [Cellvibrio polysaccharolyticus]|uniref:Uncharacterized protein n=1 Tax=Cellvibrio polysaccharolyticus TaxID=2082724 RepID=A0A928YU62_9GAMM|nr:hypothetical protein [Cellvibrio polysaccharolyticus]MBE8717105.1 hypothetical protein [Cellvibrio polysaccharolyticus]
MADLHMTDFYRDTARILVQLYNHFPNTIILYADDISGPNTPDEFGLPSARFQSCFSTMLWLAETGLIRYATTIRQEALDQTTLSRKALVILFSPVTLAVAASDRHFSTDTNTDTALPDVSLTHIEWLRTALNSQSSRLIEEAVQTILAHPLLN